MAAMVWMRLPRTWPVSTAPLEIAMVRKRATMPSVMSVDTEMAVPVALPVRVSIRTPGTMYAR